MLARQAKKPSPQRDLGMGAPPGARAASDAGPITWIACHRLRLEAYNPQSWRRLCASGTPFQPVAASGWVPGRGPALPVLDVPMAPLASLPLVLLLEVLAGVLGGIFNGLLLGYTRVFRQLQADRAYGGSAAAGDRPGGLALVVLSVGRRARADRR